MSLTPPPPGRDITASEALGSAAEFAGDCGLDGDRVRSAAVNLFARRVSHDLSNFLTVIRTYTELMMADVPLEHPNRGDLQEISDAAEATIGYIQRMSAAGRASVRRAEHVDLDAMVQDVLAGGAAAELGPIEAHLTCRCTVRGSQTGLADALRELLRNARDASPAGATLNVHSRAVTLAAPPLVHGVPIPAGNWGVVEVRDRGAGVRIAPTSDGSTSSADTDPFQPFVTTKSGVRGAGLGLPIARSAAWAAGGELTLGRDGSETVARLWLPMATEASA